MKGPIDQLLGIWRLQSHVCVHGAVNLATIALDMNKEVFPGREHVHAIATLGHAIYGHSQGRRGGCAILGGLMVHGEMSAHVGTGCCSKLAVRAKLSRLQCERFRWVCTDRRFYRRSLHTIDELDDVMQVRPTLVVQKVIRMQ